MADTEYQPCPDRARGGRIHSADKKVLLWTVLPGRSGLWRLAEMEDGAELKRCSPDKRQPQAASDFRNGEAADFLCPQESHVQPVFSLP